jgi:multiple sugar transport system substrate-binding protein
MTNMIAAGTKFDIFYATTGNYESNLIDNGIEVDMSELIRTHKIDLSRIDPNLLEPIRQFWGGKMYGIPIVNSTFINYYNKDIFDKFGVPYPKDKMQWSEITAIAKKLTRKENGIDYYGYGTSSTHLIRQNSFSLPMIDMKTETPTLNVDPRWKTFFNTAFVEPVRDQLYLERFQAKKAIPAYNEFVNEKNVGMLLYNNQLFILDPFKQEMKKFNWDMVSMPSFAELPGVGAQGYPTMFGINRLSKNVEEAMDVLKFMASDEFQIGVSRRGFMGVLKDTNIFKDYGKDTDFPDKNMQAVFQVKLAPITSGPSYMTTVQGHYNSAVLEVAQGTKDMNTAFRDAEEKAKKVIAENKAR